MNTTDEDKKRMIMSRTPLRLSFVGGGTDLPAFYRSFGKGAVVSAAINRYIYIAVNRKFDSKIRASYSVTEIVDNVDQIKHNAIRECLRFLGIDGGIEIVSISDIPSHGTGLGSSSTFVVGLLNALHAYKGEHASAKQLAEESVKVEREILMEPGGKQDQYLASFGGVELLEFFDDEKVSVSPVIMKESVRKNLRENLLLLYTGKERDSTTIIEDQSKQVQEHSESYKKMRDLSYSFLEAVNKGDIDAIGNIMDQNWQEKRKLSPNISNSWIDEMYSKAKENGALGGKIVGAGGGGFLFLVAKPEDHQKIISGLNELKPVDFSFDYNGSKIIFIGE